MKMIIKKGNETYIVRWSTVIGSFINKTKCDDEYSKEDSFNNVYLKKSDRSDLNNMFLKLIYYIGGNIQDSYLHKKYISSFENLIERHVFIRGVADPVYDSELNLELSVKGIDKDLINSLINFNKVLTKTKREVLENILTETRLNSDEELIKEFSKNNNKVNDLSDDKVIER